MRVHRAKDKEIVKAYRLIPYGELADVLRRDEVAFLEDSEGELRRGTIWKAARRLSEIIGRRVAAERAYLRLEDGTYIPGYSFYLVPEDRERRLSQPRSET
jgi:hypothetical protein